MGRHAVWAVVLVLGCLTGAVAESPTTDTKGTVISASEGSVKLKVGDATATYVAGKEDVVAKLEVSQLVPGDVVTVTWAWYAETRTKVVKNIEGRGTVVGKITGLGDRWIEITPKGGKAQKFRPCWVGGNPADGGGPDKEMLKILGRQKVGHKVALTWEMPEGKRVVAIKEVD